MWLLFSWLKLDTWPRSAILDLPFIARRPRWVLPTSFTADVTSKLTRDDWGRGCKFPARFSDSQKSFVFLPQQPFLEDLYIGVPLYRVNKHSLMSWITAGLNFTGQNNIKHYLTPSSEDYNSSNNVYVKTEGMMTFLNKHTCFSQKWPLACKSTMA